MENIFADFNISEKDIISINPLCLAFIGDSIHTLYVRQHIVLKQVAKLGNYNKKCSYFCKAKTQSLVLDEINDLLSEDEKDIVRRTRNCKTNNIAKNSNLMEYKKATCFEALIGYLYLKKDYLRLQKMLEISVKEREII